MKIVITTPLYKRVNNLVKNHYITTRQLPSKKGCNIIYKRVDNSQ